jgi:dihydroorotate dehydrogenase (fumarate)
VIASLNGTTPGGWLEFAKLLEQAGADALELNLYGVAADPDETSERIERRDRELVRSLRGEVGVPLAVKLSPFFTALAHTARELVQAGAGGLVLFNRFYQPDLDLDALEVVPHLVLSRPEELRVPLRWIAILRGRLDASLAATSGVHGSEDALKALLAGADAVMLASALLERGPERLREIEGGIRSWMEQREYESVEQLKGSLSQRCVPHPDAFERANYVRVLKSWAGGARS